MVNREIVELSLKDSLSWGKVAYREEGIVLTKRIPDNLLPQNPMRFNFIFMALCIQGEATYTIDTRRHRVTKNDLYFVSEGHIVDEYEASPDFECLCIMVSTPYYHGFVQNVQNVSSLLLFSMKNPVAHLTPEEAETFSSYYHTVCDRINDTSHPFAGEIVKALMLAMFYDMSAVIWRMDQQANDRLSRSETLFMQFIRLLEENFRLERHVSWYSRAMNITPKYLSEIVRQASTRTPTDWIDSYVILEIRVLLKNSSMSIKEIADTLHFSSQSFLGKYFKDHVGMSPLEYRHAVRSTTGTKKN